ncbi:MAG: ThiF family adenylyltransferase, partial [Dehalococcoidales bacterium]
MLTRDELTRYDRQIMLKGLGQDGQEKLKKARVFVAGAGGLGSPIAVYLAVAGVGNIRIVDHDTIE